MESDANLGSEHLEALASVGFTGHMGGLTATEQLAEACDLGPGDVVLDVGAGTGATPRFLAAEYGCRVVGVDISSAMVAWATDRSRHLSAGPHPQFAVADATRLPFAAGCFDAVICESVLAFVDDVAAALSEFGRVADENGVVGVNEATWLGSLTGEGNVPEMIDAAFETPAGWENAFADAGLHDVDRQVHRNNLRSLFVNELRRHGPRELLSAALHTGKRFLTDTAFRQFVGTVLASGTDTLALLRRLGYGIYVADAD